MTVRPGVLIYEVAPGGVGGKGDDDDNNRHAMHKLVRTVLFPNTAGLRRLTSACRTMTMKFRAKFNVKMPSTGAPGRHLLPIRTEVRSSGARAGSGISDEREGWQQPRGPHAPRGASRFASGSEQVVVLLSWFS